MKCFNTHVLTPTTHIMQRKLNFSLLFHSIKEKSNLLRVPIPAHEMWETNTVTMWTTITATTVMAKTTGKGLMHAALTRQRGWHNERRHTQGLAEGVRAGELCGLSLRCHGGSQLLLRLVGQVCPWLQWVLQVRPNLTYTLTPTQILSRHLKNKEHEWTVKSSCNQYRTISPTFWTYLTSPHPDA